jgi:flagellar biosynthesis GTPase FlhF
MKNIIIAIVICVSYTSGWSQTPNQQFQQQQQRMNEIARQSAENAARMRQANEERLRQMQADREAAAAARARQQAEWNARQRQNNENALARQAELNRTVGDSVEKIQKSIQDNQAQTLERMRESRRRREEAQSQNETFDTLESPPSSSPSSPAPLLPPRSNLDGERFPQTRNRLINDNEAAGMDFSELRYAINEVYARYGFGFSKSPAIRKRFNQFGWYRPNEQITMDQIDATMTSAEHANIVTLAKYRDAKK